MTEASSQLQRMCDALHEEGVHPDVVNRAVDAAQRQRTTQADINAIAEVVRCLLARSADFRLNTASHDVVELSVHTGDESESGLFVRGTPKQVAATAAAWLGQD